MIVNIIEKIVIWLLVGLLVEVIGYISDYIYLNKELADKNHTLEIIFWTMFFGPISFLFLLVSWFKI